MMYWLLILLGGAAWVLATRQSIANTEAPGRAATELTPFSVRWNRATRIERAGLAIVTIGRIAWVGLIMLTFVAVMIGTASWMY